MNVIEAGDVRLEPQVAAHATEMFVVLSDPAIYEFENEPPARRLFAVFKRANFRSRRLLERLGFAPGSPQQYVEQQVEPDEDLMSREIRSSDEG